MVRIAFTDNARAWWAAVVALATLGLALRLASAQGGLWLDEAWSAEMARDAGTPLAVFLGINHDNNHHLNTLWLQLAGFGASPPLARALAIASGTLAIPVAALVGAVRDRLTGLLTALAFAVAPVMVTMGSEARGYAPMSLAFLVAVLLVHRSLAQNDMRSRATAIALAFFLGLLAQLTMAFAICAILGWVAVERWRRGELAKAIRDTIRLLGPGLVAAALVAALVLVPAHLAGTGFRFGGYAPYDTLFLLHGLIEILGYAIGWPVVSLGLIALALGALVLAPRMGASRWSLYAFAILGFPLGLVVIQSANVGHPRYYLLVAMAVLLMLAEMVAFGLRRGGWPRGAALAALAAFAVGSAAQDIDLIRNQRGDPAAVVAILKARAPGGARLMIARDMSFATMRVAAATARYPLAVVPAHCPPGRYLLLERWRGESFPPRVTLCGTHFRPFAQRLAHGMSGTHWTLYERRP